MRLDDKAANFVFETCGVFPVEIELVNIQGKESAKLARFQQKFHPKTLGKTNKQSYFQKDPFFAPQQNQSKDAQLQPNTVSFHRTISALVFIGNAWRKAMLLMQRMCQVQLQPDVRTFNATISCCKMEEKWREAVDLLVEMKKLKVMANVVSYNTAMSCCEGEWQVALALLQSMFADSLQPDVITYSTAINSTATSGNWQMAMLLFMMINQQRLQSDVICFGAVISSCVKSGQWQHALLLVETGLVWLICESFLREKCVQKKTSITSQSNMTVERFETMFQLQEF